MTKQEVESIADSMRELNKEKKETENVLPIQAQPKT